MTENKLPYYSRFDTPILENRLHKAIFNGRTLKVKKLLVEGYNVYETTSKNETSLFLAIALDHTDIANLIIDIYEQDLDELTSYFETLEIETNFWIKETIFIAYGAKQIDFVKKRAIKLRVSDPRQYYSVEKHKGLIIMLKETNYSNQRFFGFH